MQKNKQVKKKNVGQAMKFTIVGLMILLGAAVLLYPTFSNWFNLQQRKEEVRHYEQDISEMAGADVDHELSRAVSYNDSLRGDPITDPFIPGSGRALPQDYLDILNFESGIICYLRIPKIDLELPVMHGTGEEVLQTAVGHMEGTAFPVGGYGNHTVLTGHTGLPSAKLFTDLVELEEGDRFYIHVLGNVLAYEVDQITVIDPADISALSSYHDQDYITLITCTPYGINSHRLLVRGSRVFEYAQELDVAARDTLLYKILLGLSTGTAVVMIPLLAAERRRKKRNRKSSAGRK